MNWPGYSALSDSRSSTPQLNSSATTMSFKKPNGTLALTELGKEAARDLASVQPVLSQLSVPFDRLLWSIQDYPRSSLIKKRAHRTKVENFCRLRSVRE